MSLVSVIIPCYNYARYLPDCVASVLSQEGVDVKVLIIDDASQDNTPEVGRLLASRDERVQYRRHIQNAGHIATYNEGIEWAAGDYTVLLSADDLLVPSALRRAARLFEAHPCVGLVYGRVVRFQTSPPSYAEQDGCSWQIISGVEWLATRCGDTGNTIVSPEAIVRTSLQKQLGGYRPELPHTADLEMWMRFAAHADVGILDAEQAYYRVHGQNMHLRRFDAILTDLQHRKAAFDVLFETQGVEIPNRDTLQQTVQSGLAENALWAACQAFDQTGDTTTVQQLIGFAFETCRSARSLPAYTRLRWRMTLGHHLYSLLYQLRRLARGPRQTPWPVARSASRTTTKM